MEYHHGQRPQDEAWVRELQERMQEGLERSSYPIKVILTDDQAWDAYSLPALTGDGSVSLPEMFRVKVFDGQHRIEALRGLPIESTDKWWLAVVYRAALERDSPAIFYTMMHLGNEQETKKPHNDADQFLLVHRLRRLREGGRLSTVDYKESAERIMGLPHCTARQAIPALVRCKSVSTKIAEMLNSPQVRAQFALGAWKRLVTGRLYQSQLTCWILDESERQMLLLNGTTMHPVPAAFMLPVAKCAWSHLESAVTRADHPWQELEGGAEAALKRVRYRPQRERAMNPLDRMDKQTWTFESHVLLPAVLSSNLVEKELIKMNLLCQHLVHIIAGPTAVKNYVTRQAKDDEMCSPAGYMWATLGERGRRADGSLTNFPDLSLTDELASEGIKDVATTTVEDYTSLIGCGHKWWEVLRLFKTSSFPLGLPVIVPKVFPDIQTSSSVTPTQSLSSNMESLRHESPRLQGESAASQSVVDQEVAIQGQRISGTPMDMDRGIACSVGSNQSSPDAIIPTGDSRSPVRDRPVGGHLEDLEQTGLGIQSTQPVVKQVPRKRRRCPSPRIEGVNGDEEEVNLHQGEIAAPSGVGLAVESNGLGHRGLNTCITQFTNKTRNLGPVEAMVVADLLNALMELPSPRVLTDVAKGLVHRVPRLKRKALKREEVDYDDDDDDDENESGQ
ncbi:hypothetical protein FRC06_007352 [Ceratobasidium sp. 370]|nr:hypothetical protein FRC06_007352 [Ceratobasidium sp. 370]